MPQVRPADLRVIPDSGRAVSGGRQALLGVDVMTPLRGGVPLVEGGHVLGAVGVSGAASAAQDEGIANAVAAALR